MRSVIAVLLAVALVAQAKVVPNGGAPAQQTTSEPAPLSDLITQAQANINNLATQIREHINTNQEAVVNTVKEQSSTLAHNVQDYVKNVTEEIKNKNPELERLWTDVKGKIGEAVEKLNEQVPEGQDQLNKMSTNFQNFVQLLVQESDRAAKSIEHNSEKLQEDVAKFAKQAVDIAVEATQNMNSHLQQAAAPKE